MTAIRRGDYVVPLGSPPGTRPTMVTVATGHSVWGYFTTDGVASYRRLMDIMRVPPPEENPFDLEDIE